MTQSASPNFDFPNPETTTLGSPLLLEGKALSVESADLSLRMITETWDGEKSLYLADPQLQMVLDIYVDENSGEDGAPAPFINLTFKKPIAKPDDFFRTEWTQEDGTLEASYGNGAPTLEENRLVLSGLEDGQVRLRWSARYEEDGRRLPFLFDGRAAFQGLKGTVKTPADFQSTLAKVAPGWASVRPQIAPKVDFDLSPGGEKWLDCTITLD